MAAVIEKTCTILASIFLVVMLVMIFVGTMSRYLLNHPFYFVEEYSAYLLVGMGYLSISYALKRNAHITVKVATNHLHTKTRSLVGMLTTCIAGCISGILFWYSLKLCATNFQINALSPTIMETPLWIPQMFIWIGWLSFILLLFSVLTRHVKTFFSKELYQDRATSKPLA